ncbi:hypothetical protein EV182_005401, partial [Spiromyces aspiralis]
ILSGKSKLKKFEWHTSKVFYIQDKATLVAVLNDCGFKLTKWESAMRNLKTSE